MRTKTLLLTAALSAAGIASSMAQAVYSVNAVGYVNTTIAPGFNLIANPLDNKDTDGNTIKKLFASLPFGTQVYRYNGTSFDIATKDDLVGDFDPPAVANYVLKPGEGVFVNTNTQQTHTVTFVGEVMQGNLSNPIPAGYSIRASQVPQEGTATALGYTPVGGDQLYFWTGTKYNISTYDQDFGFDNPLPSLKVGEAFFIRKNAAGSWNRTFTVSGQ